MGLEFWTPEYSEALRRHVAAELSYRDAVIEINREFGTAFTRNGAIGRGSRMGLKAPARPGDNGKKPVVKARLPRPIKVCAPPAPPHIPRSEIELRCAEIKPRLVALVDLEHGGCRYPYGEGPYLFCGHSRQDGSSYCAGHRALSMRPLHGNMGQARPHFAALLSRVGGHRSSAMKLASISGREEATL